LRILFLRELTNTESRISRCWCWASKYYNRRNCCSTTVLQIYTDQNRPFASWFQGHSR